MIQLFQKMTGLVSLPSHQRRFIPVVCFTVMRSAVFAAESPAVDDSRAKFSAILAQVAAHDFHPIRDGFTYDRELKKHGVASLDSERRLKARRGTES